MYPRLSLMAIDILSIPPAAAENERVFSGGRRTLSWDRSRISADNLEMMECIVSWMDNELIDSIYMAAEDGIPVGTAHSYAEYHSGDDSSDE